MRVGKRMFSRLVLIGAVLPAAAFADDYGCKVLLCLADPRGPMTEAECRPPIRQLFRDLARGRGFPTCVMASGPGGRSYASQGYSYYDSCPAGTTELAQGEQAVRDARRWYYEESEVYYGIGNGQGVERSYENGLPNKVCVGRRVGDGTVGRGDGQYSVSVYDRIVTMAPAQTPRYIDVFIDDKLFRRVRW